MLKSRLTPSYAETDANPTRLKVMAPRYATALIQSGENQKQCTRSWSSSGTLIKGSSSNGNSGHCMDAHAIPSHPWRACECGAIAH
jgi:hypothetical protein